MTRSSTLYIEMTCLVIKTKIVGGKHRSRLFFTDLASYDLVNNLTAGELSMVGIISDWAYGVLIVLPDHALRWQDELSHSALQLGRATTVNKDVGAPHYLNLKY